MDYVAALDLTPLDAFATLPDTLRFTSRGWVSRAESAIAQTQPFNARLAYSYAGLDIRPYDGGAQIAIARDGTPYGWDGTTWQPAAEPQFQTLDELRSRLPLWAGSIQFWIQFTPATIAAQLHIAYSLPAHDISSYLRDFAFPAIAAQPIELSRFLMPATDGLSLPVPTDCAIARMSNIRALSPGVGITSGTISGDRVTLPTPIPVAPTKLIFDYTIKAIGTSSSFEQLEDAPQVLIREMYRDNVRHVTERSRLDVRVGTDIARQTNTESLVDAVFEIQIFARRDDDSCMIADALLGRFAAIALIDCQPYGCAVPVTVDSAIAFNTSTLAIGDLNPASFRVRALQIPQGRTARTAAIVTEINAWWNDQSAAQTEFAYPLHWISAG